MVLDVEHVPLHVCLNVLGPVCVLQSVVRVLVVRAGWSNVCDHHGAAVAAERVFEEASELGVTERNVITLPLGIVFVQHVDAIAESQERLVDVGALNHAHATVAGFGGALRAGQVDERELANFDLGFDASVPVLVLANNLEDGMRS